MNPQQIADEIIAEDNIDNSNLATEEPTGGDDANDNTDGDNSAQGGADDDTQAKDDDASGDNNSSDAGTDNESTDNDAGEQDNKAEDTAEADKPAPVVSNEKSPTETVEEAQTLLSTLELTEDKIFTKDGEVVPFDQVVPAGAYLASQLQPVKVTDKDGKEHEFLLLNDVEKAFPDGFEAKNNIEQMKFERAIVNNEEKFEKAIETYKASEQRYTQETNAIVQQRSDNERIRNEYMSMADQGLVPKVEGDPNDPKYLEQPAVKELNKILEWQEAKNKDLKSKGLGQINSLWVAKQIMDTEGTKVTTNKDKQAIIEERKEVASLTNSGTPTKDNPKQVASNVPMSRFADEIIAQENLK